MIVFVALVKKLTHFYRKIRKTALMYVFFKLLFKFCKSCCSFINKIILKKRRTRGCAVLPNPCPYPDHKNPYLRVKNIMKQKRHAKNYG